MNAMPQNFYEEEEANAILKLASQKSLMGGLSRDQLLASAAELGISAEAVEEAEATYRNDVSENLLRKEYDRAARREFLSSFTTWLIVNAFLVFIDFRNSGEITWAWWTIGPWGFFILMEIPETFFKGSKDYEKHFQKWLRKREKRLAERSSMSVVDDSA